jgi:hypothetical protein
VKKSAREFKNLTYYLSEKKSFLEGKGKAKAKQKEEVSKPFYIPWNLESSIGIIRVFS